MQKLRKMTNLRLKIFNVPFSNIMEMEFALFAWQILERMFQEEQLELPPLLDYRTTKVYSTYSSTLS